MDEGTTRETNMKDEEDVNDSMDQLRNTMQNATQSLEKFCEENGLQPQAWFEARDSTIHKPQGPGEPQERISGDQVR